MNTATDRKTVSVIASAFRAEILRAEESGGHDALRMKLQTAALPLAVHFSLLSAIEASERNFRAA